MANTYELISSNTLASDITSVTFSSIPQTYTDLVIRYSARTNGGGIVGDTCNITFNSDTGNNYSRVTIRSNGSAGTSHIAANASSVNFHTNVNGSGGTANTFANIEIYIPNYTLTSTRPISVSNVQENNTATLAAVYSGASQYRGSSGISSITWDAPGSLFLTNSSFYLYGIKNS
jgi:hypothetical protein